MSDLLIPESEIAYLQSVYPLEDIKPLTRQQEMFVMHYLKGQSVASAARAAGYAPTVARRLMNQQNVKRIIEHMRDKTLRDIRVTRETLTEMLFEAHSHAETSTEEVNAIRELGKMHGLYESDSQKATKIIQGDVNVTNIKHIERASDAELMDLAGEFIELEPEKLKIERND